MVKVPWRFASHCSAQISYTVPMARSKRGPNETRAKSLASFDASDVKPSSSRPITHRSKRSHNCAAPSNLPLVLCPLHLPVLLRIPSKIDLPSERLSNDVLRPLLFKLSLHVFRDVARLRRQVQLPNVFFKLFGSEEHAKEDSRVNGRQRPISQSLM